MEVGVKTVKMAFQLDCVEGCSISIWKFSSGNFIILRHSKEFHFTELSYYNFEPAKSLLLLVQFFSLQFDSFLYFTALRIIFWQLEFFIENSTIGQKTLDRFIFLKESVKKV